ncbi:uncharacterized protein LOC144175397 [Haemaphysalis longicornis]
MQISNPFVFFVQIIVALLPLPVDYGGSAQAPKVNPIRLTHDYDANAALTLGIIDTCWLHRPTGTTQHACAGYNAALVAFRAPSGIKPGQRHPSLTGHGSTAGMQISNPFVFFVQIIVALLPLPVDYGGSAQAPKVNPIRLTHDYDANAALTLGIIDTCWLHRPTGTTQHACAGYNAALAAFRAPSGIKPGQRHPSLTGHGSTAGMQISNPFVFFVQVSKRYGKCFRSSDPCLIVLPCPRLLCPMLSDMLLYALDLLLLSGDVETNPGPDLAKIAKQIELIANDIKEIKEGRLASIDAKLENLTVLDSKISTCMDQVSNLQKEITALELKLDDLENRSRRSNLIFYGIEEDKNENNESLEDTINEKILKNILEIEPVAIERIHRLGRAAEGKNRPVILKLLNSRDKAKVFKNCHKLKETDFAISEDFSPRVREIRRKLWNSARANKDAGDKVTLSYDKLYINKETFIWDNEKNDKVPIKDHRNHPPTTKNSQDDTPTTRTRRPRHQK